MSADSISIPHRAYVTGEPSKSPNEFSANSTPCYRISIFQENAVRKILIPENLNCRAKVWMAQDLSIYTNSEYVYATYPIALSFFYGKGCREIAELKPLSMISTILPHGLNTTDINNYFVRTDRRWFWLDTSIKGLAPLAPLDTFSPLRSGRTPG